MTEIKENEFFKGFDWKELQQLKMKPPADVLPNHQNDILQLDMKRPNFVDTDYENSSNMMNRIKGFTFIRSLEQ